MKNNWEKGVQCGWSGQGGLLGGGGFSLTPEIWKELCYLQSWGKRTYHLVLWVE